MAIEYTYYLSGTEPCNVAEVISHARDDISEIKGSLITFTEFMPTVTLSKPSRHPEVNVFHDESLGFRPSACAHFRLDKNHLAENEDAIIKTVSALLSQFAGPAILLLNGEKPMLKRLNERLILNSDTTFWSPERLHLIDSYHALLPMEIL